eukprot:scaffold37879_cov205-Skeletonema_dohrnii-CCMP3373.AAC.1
MKRFVQELENTVIKMKASDIRMFRYGVWREKGSLASSSIGKGNRVSSWVWTCALLTLVMRGD